MSKKIEEKLNSLLKRVKKEESKKDSLRMDLLLAEKFKAKGYNEAAEQIENSLKLKKVSRSNRDSDKKPSFLAGVHIMLKSFTYSLTFFATVAIVVAIAVPVYLHYYAPESEGYEWFSFLFPNEESADPFENGFPDENGSNKEIRNEIALSLTADKSKKSGGYIVPKMSNVVTLEVGDVTEDEVKKYVEVNEGEEFEVRKTDQAGTVELVLSSEDNDQIDADFDKVNSSKGYEIKFKPGLELSSGERLTEEMNLIIPVKPDFEIKGLPYFTPIDYKSRRYVSETEAEKILVIEFTHSEFDTLTAAENIAVRKVTESSVLDVDNLTVYKEGRYLKFVSAVEWDDQSQYVVVIEEELCDEYEDCIISQRSFEVEMKAAEEIDPTTELGEYNFVRSDKDKYLSDEKVKANVDVDYLVEIGEAEASSDIVNGQLQVYRYINEIEQSELIFTKTFFPDQDGYQYNFAPSSSMLPGNETEFLIAAILFDEQGKSYSALKYIQVYRSSGSYVLDLIKDSSEIDIYELQRYNVLTNQDDEGEYEYKAELYIIDRERVEKKAAEWNVLIKSYAGSSEDQDKQIVVVNKSTGEITVDKTQLPQNSDYSLLLKWDCVRVKGGKEECVEFEYDLPYIVPDEMFNGIPY